MGVLKLSFQLVLYSVIFAVLLTIIPGLPPHYIFEAYSIEAPRLLEGKLAANDILDKAELLIDVDAKFEGIDSVALRGNSIYAGVIGGDVIRIEEDGKWGKIGEIPKNCDGSWKSPCPAPLGSRFNKDGKLVIVDANRGLLEINVDTGSVKVLVATGTKLSDGLPVNFLDDLDVDRNGVIYFTDLGTRLTVQNPFLDAFAEPTGRFLKYDPKTKKVDILISGLHLANGVQLSQNEDFVVVGETMRNTVWKYHLKGDKKGEKEIFIDRLPGGADNIRSNGKGGFYIPMLYPDIEEAPNHLNSLLPLPSVRKFVLRLQFILHKIIENAIYPHSLAAMLHDYVSHLGPLGDISKGSRKVIIIEVDETGNIINSFHNKNGKVALVSALVVGKQWGYIASPFTGQLWRIDVKHLK